MTGRIKTELWLPWPPTANTMFGLHGHRRFVSRSYATWKLHAGEHLEGQKPTKFDGPVNISIALKNPRKARWDVDNRVKPVIDLLVTHQVIEDDNHEVVRRVTAFVGDAPGATVTVEDAE